MADHFLTFYTPLKIYWVFSYILKYSLVTRFLKMIWMACTSPSVCKWTFVLFFSVLLLKAIIQWTSYIFVKLSKSFFDISPQNLNYQVKVFKHIFHIFHQISLLKGHSNLHSNQTWMRATISHHWRWRFPFIAALYLDQLGGRR